MTEKIEFAGKTLTAPLDRVKLLLQTGGGFSRGSLKSAAQKGSMVQSLIAIGKQEGLAGYWKGNVPQVHTSIQQYCICLIVICHSLQHSKDLVK